MPEPTRLATAALLALAAASFATLSPAAPAAAQPPGADGRNKIDAVRFDVHGSFGWFWALGVGGRVEFAIVPDGFIDSLDDELAISVGADAQFFGWNDRSFCTGYACFGDWSVWTPVTAQLNIYLTPDWSVFPELGGAVGFYDCGPTNNRGVCVTGTPVVGVGGRWHFAPERLSLLVRISYPFGLQAGLVF
jgi:hypothetical protein